MKAFLVTSFAALVASFVIAGTANVPDVYTASVFNMAALRVDMVPAVTTQGTGTGLPPTGSQGQELQNPLKIPTIEAFFAEVLQILIIIATPIIVLMIVYAGFLFLTARGNETKITKAKQTLGWTLAGAALILGAATILATLKATVETL